MRDYAACEEGQAQYVGGWGVLQDVVGVNSVCIGGVHAGWTGTFPRLFNNSFAMVALTN